MKETIDKLKIEEKIGQLSCNLFGWKSYENNGDLITEYLIDELNKYKTIGSIYGVLRSDPWSGKTYANGVKEGKESGLLNRITEIVSGSQNIQPFYFEETPHGHQALNSTSLPVNLAVGCTFDKNTYKELCSQVAKEMRTKGVNVGLLSCLDLALDPRWGRTEECYGEDTFLAMELAGSAIKGYQGESLEIPSDKIGIVAKHFIGQGSALGGHNGTSVSIGEKELISNHLPIAQSCIDANVLGFMAAYNDLDSVPCHANKKLIDSLRNEMGFKGFVMSDGCAIDNLTNFTNDHAKSIALAIKSGINIDLWNESFNYIKEALDNNYLSEEDINKALEYVLLSKFRLQANSAGIELEQEKIKQLNYDLARKSVVLLKNESKLLPLNNLNQVCLIGPYIESIYHQLGDYTPFQKNNIKSLAEEFDIPHCLGNYPRENKEELILEAVEMAKKSKYVILNLGSSSARDFDVIFDRNGAAISSGKTTSFMDCGEGMDVAEVKISEPQQRLFDEIYKVNKNIILIITSGRPVGIKDISQKSMAIIQSFYGGQEIARVLKDLIIGKTHPSGRLSISIPESSSQLPVYYWMKESKKYVDQTNLPLYEFGYGKTYSEIKLEKIEVNNLADNCYEVCFDIETDSEIAIEWPVLVFATISQTTTKPPKKQLVGFERINIKPGIKNKKFIKVDLNWLYKIYNFKEVEIEVS